MELFFTKEAIANLRRLDAATQDRILKKIEWLAEQDAPFLLVKQLANHPGIYALRVGKYRILLSADGAILTVHRVGRRDEVYRKM